MENMKYLTIGKAHQSMDMKRAGLERNACRVDLVVHSYNNDN